MHIHVITLSCPYMHTLVHTCTHILLTHNVILTHKHTHTHTHTVQFQCCGYDDPADWLRYNPAAIPVIPLFSPPPNCPSCSTTTDANCVLYSNLTAGRAFTTNVTVSQFVMLNSPTQSTHSIAMYVYHVTTALAGHGHSII